MISDLSPERKAALRSRFLSHTEHRDGHLVWTGATSHGYGIFRTGKKSWARAHRAAYELFVGPIPDGMILLHGCDTPTCVDWASGHLRPGTHKENRAEMFARGRYRWGVLRGEDANIVQHYEGGQSVSAIARLYGVDSRAVWQVLKKAGTK